MKKLITVFLAILFIISCTSTSVFAIDSIDRTLTFESVTSLTSGVNELKYVGIYYNDNDKCFLNTDEQYTHKGSAKSLMFKSGATRNFYYNSDSGVIMGGPSANGATVQNCYHFEYNYYVKIASFEDSYTNGIVYSDDVYFKKTSEDPTYTSDNGLQLRIMSDEGGEYITTTDQDAIKIFPWNNGRNDWIQIRRIYDFNEKSIATYADNQIISKKYLSQTGLYAIRYSYIRVFGTDLNNGIYVDDVSSKSLVKPALEVSDISYVVDHANDDNVLGRVMLKGNGAPHELWIFSAVYEEDRRRLLHLNMERAILLNGETEKEITFSCGKPDDGTEINIMYFYKDSLRPVKPRDKLTASSISNDIITLSETKLYSNYPNSGTHERPTPEKLLADYKVSPQYEKHPRIMLTPEKVTALKTDIMVSGSKKKVWYDKISDRRRQLYNQLTGIDKDSYILKHTDCYEQRMTIAGGNVADLFMDQMMICGMMYQLTGESIHAQTAWIQIEAVSAFPNWNTSHDLDFGILAQGYAIAYDWMFDYWSAEQKNIIENTIYNLCFMAANKSYENNRIDGTVMGVWVANNHNAIVNGGIAMASLAFMDVYPVIASNLDVDALRCLEFLIDLYAPDGALPDGYEYSVLTVEHLAAVLSSFESSIGTCYGLDCADGIDKATNILHYMSSDLLGFNFGDSDNGLLSCPGQLWFYKHYEISGFKDALVSQSRYNSYNSNLVSLLTWYDPAAESSGISLEKDMNCEKLGFATMRSDFAEGQSFAGIKGGTAKKDYFYHMDQGSFVFDALGVRWGYDMGKDNYNLPGYMQPSGDDRWKIFRLRPEGHNALVIDPYSSTPCYEFGNAALTMESGETSVKAVVDMTAVQGNKVSKAERGFLLTDNRSSLVVRDEVSLAGTSDLYWIMYTKATVTVNGSRATLTDKINTDKTLTIDFLSSGIGTLSTEAASPCSFSPVVNGQNSNTEYTRIVYKLSGKNGVVDITAKLTPKDKGLTEVSQYNQSIDNWVVD